MRTEVCLHLAHLIVLSSSALIPDTSNQEFFCFRTKSELGHSQCTFLRRSSAVASVLFYWTIWTADHHVEECSISAEPALIQNYISVCHKQGTWDLHKTSSLRLNITLLLDPGSPCEFRPIALGNFRRHRYFGTSFQMDSGFRIRQKRALILPGTLWCGHGSRAGDYEQLGMFERVDRCCRAHDHCDYIIHPFTVNFGIFNPTLFTISHCDCDHRFKQCLLDINDTVSNMVGYTFFNLLKPHCFELIPKRRCTKMNWIGMCTSDNVAPYAILKHTTTYNATTSNTGTSKPVCQRKPSANTKQKNMKLKERKQSTSQKNHGQKASAARHTVLLSENIGQPYSAPQAISPVSNIAQPNCLMSCNTTQLFNWKSKLIQQGTPFLAAASTAHLRISSTKGMNPPSKKGTPKKGKNITQRSQTTVQTGLNKRYNTPKMTPKLIRGPTRADNLLPKQQRRKNDMQDNVPLQATVSPKSFTLSMANKLLRTNKFIKSISQINKETNSSSRKTPFNRLPNRSQPQKINTSEVKHKSADSTKHSKTWNNTICAYETFKQTDVLPSFSRPKSLSHH